MVSRSTVLFHGEIPSEYREAMANSRDDQARMTDDGGQPTCTGPAQGAAALVPQGQDDAVPQPVNAGAEGPTPMTDDMTNTTRARAAQQVPPRTHMQTVAAAVPESPLNQSTDMGGSAQAQTPGNDGTVDDSSTAASSAGPAVRPQQLRAFIGAPQQASQRSTAPTRRMVASPVRSAAKGNKTEKDNTELIASLMATIQSLSATIATLNEQISAMQSTNQDKGKDRDGAPPHQQQRRRQAFQIQWREMDDLGTRF